MEAPGSQLSWAGHPGILPAHPRHPTTQPAGPQPPTAWAAGLGLMKAEGTPPCWPGGPERTRRAPADIGGGAKRLPYYFPAMQQELARDGSGLQKGLWPLVRDGPPEVASLQTGYGSRRLDTASLLNHLPTGQSQLQGPHPQPTQVSAGTLTLGPGTKGSIPEAPRSRSQQAWALRSGCVISAGFLTR